MADKKISQLTAATTPLAGTEVLPIVQSGSTVKVSIANVTAGRSIATGPITATVADNGGVSIAQSIAGETGFLNFVDSDAGLAGRVKYDHSNDSLQLFSNALERVRIDSSGNVKNNSGNFILGTAAKGVSFPENTTAAGMTSTLLNWYEEGLWTPVLTFETPGDLSITYGAQVGTYTRIGRAVTIAFRITTTAFSYSTASGNLLVTGLPFTARTLTNMRWQTACAFNGITRANYTQFNAQLDSATSVLEFNMSGSGQSQSGISTTHVPSGGAPFLAAVLTYEA